MKLIVIAISLVFFSTSFAQEKPSLNRWRGMTIDLSSVEDAIKALGSPTKDQSGEKFIPTVYSKWFGNKPIDGFRRLTFKGLEGFDKAELYFMDNKLKVIDLDMKKDLSAAAITDAYEERFYPLVGNFGKAVTPSQLAKPDREVDYPDRFPLAYNLGAANDKVVGLAYASSGFAESFAAGMVSGPYRRPTAISESLPGLVRRLQLISRSLENKKGVDLLK